MSKITNPLYKFGPFHISSSERLLFRGADMVPLSPKVLDLLLLFMESQGRLLTKDALMSALWPDTFVEEGNLAYNISVLRKALGDGGPDVQFIETVPRRGYRFVAKIEKVEPQPASGRSLWGLALLAIAFCAVLVIVFRHGNAPLPGSTRILSRVTFEAGLQSDSSWSHDGLIAYAASQGGSSHIWVRRPGVGGPVRLTTDDAEESEPEWSPDGKWIAFRSEREGGGLFLAPALGGSSQKLTEFGHHPRWSPDGSQILFWGTLLHGLSQTAALYVTTPDGKVPRRILAEFLSKAGRLVLRGATWHPGGRGITVLWINSDSRWEIWTTPLDGHNPVRSVFAPDVAARIESLGLSFSRFPWTTFDNVKWSPSGAFLVIEAFSHGVRNLWKIGVEPATLRLVSGPERLTTDTSLDTDSSISADSTRISYTLRNQDIRLWLFPFDAPRGHVGLAGRPVTRAGTDVLWPDLSPDGRQLVYSTLLSGKFELRKIAVLDSKEVVLFADEFVRAAPCWSRHGERLIYRRIHPNTSSGNRDEHAIFMLPVTGGSEQRITTESVVAETATDISKDGQWLVGTSPRESKRSQICRWLLSSAPHAETDVEILLGRPDEDFYIPRLSPDDRWLAFVGFKAAEPAASKIYVIPAHGGDPIPIVEGSSWNDKPRWSTDGKKIYFLSDRGEYFNVWAVPFDPLTGHVTGTAFQVTTLGNPTQMIFPLAGGAALSFSSNWLALPMLEVSGSIWQLEKIDR